MNHLLGSLAHHNAATAALPHLISMLTRPSVVLRLEEASLLLGSVLLYRHLHFSWVLFGALFLAPDLFMLGYLVNTRIGSALYNLGHAIFVPVLLFLFAFTAQRPLILAIALIWFSHIVFDRLAGYGLKYPGDFKDTHLQHLG